MRLLEEHPEVQRRLQNQFDQVLMDEFQDTNGQQARLLGLLRSPDRFYAVGDINQSIYGFRHAEPGVFRDYRDSVSRAAIGWWNWSRTSAAGRRFCAQWRLVAAGAEGIEARPLVPGSPFPDKAELPWKWWPRPPRNSRRSGLPRALWNSKADCNCATASPSSGISPCWYATPKCSTEFTRAFDDFGIPYLVNRGKGFYETREVVDLMHLLRVLSNPRDEIEHGRGAAVAVRGGVRRGPAAAEGDRAIWAARWRGWRPRF